VKHQAAKKF